MALPAILTDAGEDAVTRFVEYFTAHICNPHTRRAYFRNAIDFLRWCEDLGLRDLKAIKPVKVAAYIEHLQQDYAKSSVKQQLATIRMLFDWLVTGQLIEVNPAHAVRGPKRIVSKGKTPVLAADEARILLDSIPIERVVTIEQEGKEIKAPDLIGLRDRAIIAAMLFTFARVGAMVAMTVEDYYAQGKRSWLRFHEKGGRQHEIPAQHTLEECIAAYIMAADIAVDIKCPLQHCARYRDKADAKPHANRRRVADDPAADQANRHSHQGRLPQFPGDGDHLLPGRQGTLEKAQQMASHASPRITKLYDRTNDQITLDEVEHLVI